LDNNGSYCVLPHFVVLFIGFVFLQKLIEI